MIFCCVWVDERCRERWLIAGCDARRLRDGRHRRLCNLAAQCRLFPVYYLLTAAPQLQAAAATRVAGKPGIIEAAESGDIELVRDRITAYPAYVHKRDPVSYDARPCMRI